MSDVVAVALITAGVTGLVGFAGLAFSFWNSSRERELRLTERREDYREWYKRTLFEKRLDALREMSLEARRLFFAVNNLSSDDVARRFAEADDWYSRNRVLLDQECTDGFLEFLNAVSIRDHGAEEAKDVLLRYNTLMTARGRWADDLLKRPQAEGDRGA